MAFWLTCTCLTLIPFPLAPPRVPSFPFKFRNPSSSLLAGEALPSFEVLKFWMSIEHFAEGERDGDSAGPLGRMRGQRSGMAANCGFDSSASPHEDGENQHRGLRILACRLAQGLGVGGRMEGRPHPTLPLDALVPGGPEWRFPRGRAGEAWKRGSEPPR